MAHQWLLAEEVITPARDQIFAEQFTTQGSCWKNRIRRWHSDARKKEERGMWVMLVIVIVLFKEGDEHKPLLAANVLAMEA